MISKIKTLGVLLAITGCSFYSFKGSIPPHINSIFISPVENHTTESAAADILKIELESTFIKENILKLLSANNSDSRLDIVVISFSDTPYSYDIENISSTGHETLSEKKIEIEAKVSWYDLVKDELLFEDQISGWSVYNPNEKDIGSDQIDNDNDGYTDDDDDDEYGPSRDSAVKIASNKISEQIVNEIVSIW